MSTKKLANRHTCLQRSQRWLQAILVQSDRIIECTTFDSASDCNLDTEVEKNFADIQVIDAHFFCIALRNSIRWLNELKRLDESLRVDINKFIKCVPQGEQLRNMLEHEDEYLKGRGKNRGKFWQDVHVKNGGLLVKNFPPFAILFHDESHLIGGRISVEKTMSAAEILLQIINSKIT